MCGAGEWGVVFRNRVGNGNPFQHSCLENSMDRGAWWAIVHGVAESDISKHSTVFRKAFLHSSGKAM